MRSCSCKKIAKIVLLVVIGVLVVGLLGLGFGLIVMWLWNALMPPIFGLPIIGYWQAVGLFVLAHLLLRGPGQHHATHRSACESPLHRHARAFLKDKTCDSGMSESDAR